MSARQVWPYVVLVATIVWSTVMVLLGHDAVAAAVVPVALPALLQLAGARRNTQGDARGDTQGDARGDAQGDARGDSARRAQEGAGESGGPEPGAEPEPNKERSS